MAVPVHRLQPRTSRLTTRLPAPRREDAAARWTRPSVIAHRGACGYRPEHTMAAYALALALGADALEVDVVPTADGELVCRHETDLAVSTDVAAHPDLAALRSTRSGASGWFVDELTLAQVCRLRAGETRPYVRPDNTRYDSWFGVPTLAQVLDLVEAESRVRGELVGLHVETKHPAAFAARGIAVAPLITALLRERHLDRLNGPVLVQSFDAEHLRALAASTSMPLVQLVDAIPAHAAALTPAGLREVSTYAGGVGLRKDLLLPRDRDGWLADPECGAELVDRAHGAGLSVSVWTLRDENAYLPLDLRSDGPPSAKGDAHAEVLLAAQTGVDGLITDHVDTARAALAACVPAE